MLAERREASAAGSRGGEVEWARRAQAAGAAAARRRGARWSAGVSRRGARMEVRSRKTSGLMRSAVGAGRTAPGRPRRGCSRCRLPACPACGARRAEWGRGTRRGSIQSSLDDELDLWQRVLVLGGAEMATSMHHHERRESRNTPRRSACCEAPYRSPSRDPAWPHAHRSQSTCFSPRPHGHKALLATGDGCIQHTHGRGMGCTSKPWDARHRCPTKGGPSPHAPPSLVVGRPPITGTGAAPAPSTPPPQAP
jgi:hypothetical protein